MGEQRTETEAWGRARAACVDPWSFMLSILLPLCFLEWNRESCSPSTVHRHFPKSWACCDFCCKVMQPGVLLHLQAPADECKGMKQTQI